MYVLCTSGRSDGNMTISCSVLFGNSKPTVIYVSQQENVSKQWAENRDLPMSSQVIHVSLKFKEIIYNHQEIIIMVPGNSQFYQLVQNGLRQF